MKSHHLSLLLALVATPALGQRTPPPLYLGNERISWTLFRPVTIDQPTVLALIALEGDRQPKDAFARAQAVADSILVALGPIAARRGYAVEVRVTSYLGLDDPRHGAHYQPSPERGPGILLIRPGLKPSRFYPLLTPEELVPVIEDYSQLVHPLVPA
jgi:hypothetical protein